MIGETSPGGRTILVTGATGFIGRAVIEALRQRGDTVLALSRDPSRAQAKLGPGIDIHRSLSEIAPERTIDGIVNLAGEPLAGGLWTSSRRRRFIDSRVNTTAAILDLATRLRTRPAVLVNGSAVGFYGDRGEELLTEQSEPQTMFISEICRKWEARANAAGSRVARIVKLRFGMVLDRDGGALPPLLTMTRLGLGTIMGSGRQYLAWIHRRDVVRLILEALDNPAIEGPINAVAPEPVRYAEFMRTMGRLLHRPVLLRIPAPLLRLGLNGLADLFLISQKVAPERAAALGFVFDYPTLEAALTEITARR